MECLIHTFIILRLMDFPNHPHPLSCWYPPGLLANHINRCFHWSWKVIFFCVWTFSVTSQFLNSLSNTAFLNMCFHKIWFIVWYLLICVDLNYQTEIHTLRTYSSTKMDCCFFLFMWSSWRTHFCCQSCTRSKNISCDYGNVNICLETRTKTIVYIFYTIDLK